MAHTRHGHQIPKSSMDGKSVPVVNCGGVKICRTCIQDIENYHLRFMGEPTDYPAKAKKIVDEHVGRRLRSIHNIPDIPAYELYIESFTYTLGNWKAWVGTTMDDKMMYQVTYDAAKRVAYLDEYRKLANIPIPD